MSRVNKLLSRIKTKPKDFSWDELTSLLTLLGFDEIRKGKTAGSRKKFLHPTLQLMIHLHKPHPNPVLKSYIINQVLEVLQKGGLI